MAAIAAPDGARPAVGARIRVYWTVDRRWYGGVALEARAEAPVTLHRVLYDDGDELWHDLARALRSPLVRVKL